MFLNLTPHAITVRGIGNLAPSGVIPRVSSKRIEIQNSSGVRMVKNEFGAVEGLPDAVDGTILIVSGMVLAALNGSRPDVFAPDTGPDAVRVNGQISEVLGLVC